MANGIFQNAFQGISELVKDGLGIAGQVFVAREEGEARKVEAAKSAEVLSTQALFQSQQFQLAMLVAGGLALLLLLKKR